MRMILNVSELAYQRWEICGRPADNSLADWLAAERLSHQVIEEAAYFRWLNRGRPIGDPWTDWLASEAEIASGRPVYHLSDSFVDERLRQQVIEEAAYFRWLNRGQPIGDPWTDWFASVAEVVKRGWKLTLGLIPW